jgi:hypothetical protein
VDSLWRATYLEVKWTVEAPLSKMVTVILLLGFVCGATWISIRWRRRRHTMPKKERLAPRSESGRIRLKDLLPYLDECIISYLQLTSASSQSRPPGPP